MNRGLTLVEMLVVIAIVSILLAVIVPSTIFFTSRRTLDLAPRDVFAVFKATQTYAESHGVRTALVFDISAVEDSVRGAQQPYLGRFLVARELSREEKADLGIPLSPGHFDDPVFVPLAGRDGEWREIAGNGAILAKSLGIATITLNTDNARRIPVTSPGNPPPGVVETIDRQRINGEWVDVLVWLVLEIPVEDPGNPPPGVVEIVSDGQLVWRLVTQEVTDAAVFPVQLAFDGQWPQASFNRDLPTAWADFWDSRFPAYIFTPTGQLDTPPLWTKQRVRVPIGHRPDAAPEDRFVWDDSADGPAQLPDGTGLWERHVDVEIFAATGRMRIVEGL